MRAALRVALQVSDPSAVECCSRILQPTAGQNPVNSVTALRVETGQWNTYRPLGSKSSHHHEFSPGAPRPDRRARAESAAFICQGRAAACL